MLHQSNASKVFNKLQSLGISSNHFFFLFCGVVLECECESRCLKVETNANDINNID